MSGPVLLHVGIDEGDGPPLVLLHGWPEDSRMWRHVVPSLSARFRCIALDLRGLGQSPAPPDGYDKPQLAEDVLHTLDDLGLEQVRVMGHDWGGVVAQHLCLMAPERVHKALIVDVPPLWFTPTDPRMLVGLVHMPFIASPFGERIVPTMAERLLKLAGIPDEDVRHYVDMVSEPDRRRASHLYYRTFLLSEFPNGLRSRPSEPDVPVKFIGGARDPVIRWAPRVERVRGVGHFLPEEKPDAVIGHALGFL